MACVLCAAHIMEGKLFLCTAAKSFLLYNGFMLYYIIMLEIYFYMHIEFIFNVRKICFRVFLL